MPKRKASAGTASEDGCGKAPIRRAPPSNDGNNSDDSDFCEVIEGPSAGPPASVPSAVLGHTKVAPSPAIGSTSPQSFAIPQDHGSGGPRDGDMMSMLAAGLSGAVPYMHPSHINARFGFHQFGEFQPRPAFQFAPRDVLTRPAGYQSEDYFSNYVPHHQPVSAPVFRRSSVVTSSGGVREGAAAEEVKEEPNDTVLCPTQMELPMVNALIQKGVPKDDALLSLRQHGHNVEEALRNALQTLCDRENNRREDMARYESEKEKEKIAAARRQEDMSLTVLGDVAPRFQESFLLNEKDGCAVFRRAIHEICSGEEARSPEECAFRERAVKLLFLERDALKWYRDVRPQVVGYFRKVGERLGAHVRNEHENVEAGEAGQTHASPERDSRDSLPRSDNTLSEDAVGNTQRLTSLVQEEIDSLERILFMIPSTSGGVPDAFLKCSERTATLEADGVEEVCHQSASASRSCRGGDRVVIAIDDDG